MGNAILNQGSLIKYLLRDEFITDRAAGAVNGTAAEPGPGTRTVVDTGNAITISSGNLNMPAAASTWITETLVYGTVARVAGRTMVWSIPAMPAGVGAWSVGFDADGVNQPTNGAIQLNGQTLSVQGGGTIPAAGVVVAGAAYKLAVVLKTTGAYGFIKGGAFTNWTMLWYGGTNAAATLYPMINSFSNAFPVDYIRVPTPTFLPTPIAYDTFTRANGVLGNSETTGPDAQAVPARAWTGATWTISGNAAINTPTEGGELAAGNLTIGIWYRITATDPNHFYAGCAVNDTFRATAATALDANNKVAPVTTSGLFASLTDAATANVKVRAQIGALTAKKQAGILARLDSAASPANCIIMHFDGSGNVKVEEMVAGVWQATVLSAVKAFTASDWLELDLSGTAYRAYHITAAGVATLLGSGTVATATGTIHGLFSTYSANTVLGMEVWPKGSGGEFSRLDAF